MIADDAMENHNTDSGDGDIENHNTDGANAVEENQNNDGSDGVIENHNLDGANAVEENQNNDSADGVIENHNTDGAIAVEENQNNDVADGVIENHNLDGVNAVEENQNNDVADGVIENHNLDGANDITVNHNIDGGWAWLVLAASFLIHVMTYGMAWSTSVYNVIFLDVFQQSKSLTGLAGTMQAASMYFIGPLAGMLTNKFGCRPVIMLGGLMSSVGLAVSYFASNIYYIVVTFGVLAGCGFGLAYIPAITAVSNYFNQRLIFAAGVAASGVGVGNFLYPIMIRGLVNKYDWQSSLLIIGGVTFSVSLFGALIRPIGTQYRRPAIDITPFKKTGYIMLCMNNLLWCCGISALYIHLTALSETEGIQADQGAYIISGLGIANIIGRFGYGVLGQQDRINKYIIVLYAFSFGLCGMCVCVLPLVKSFPGFMCVAVLFGIFSGCFGTLLVPILKQLLGRERFANGYGCLLLFEGAGQLTGGPLTGAMFDSTQSYTLPFLLGGGLCIASSVIMIHPYLYVRRHLRREQADTPEMASLAPSRDSSQIL